MKTTRSSSPQLFKTTQSRKNIELLEDYVEAIDEILNKKPNILTGGLNARTGKTDNYILPDRKNFLEEDEEADDLLFSERNSEDTKTNNRVEELVELRKSLNFVLFY